MYARKTQEILDRREMLKVKVKALAAEAKIIHHQERKTKGPLAEEMRLHRTKELRWEARASHLAYGLVRGRTLQQMEPRTTTELTPFFKDKVKAMLRKYGQRDILHQPHVVSVLGDTQQAAQTTAPATTTLLRTAA